MSRKTPYSTYMLLLKIPSEGACFLFLKGKFKETIYTPEKLNLFS